MTIKDFMTHDHERLEQILRDFLKARDQNDHRARELFHEFRSGIEKHMAWEEEILFPAIERRTGMHLPGPAVLVQSQHEQIKLLFKELSAHIDNEGGNEETLKALIDLLALHNREEERILYPWIDVSLGKEDREAALEEIKQHSTGR